MEQASSRQEDLRIKSKQIVRAGKEIEDMLTCSPDFLNALPDIYYIELRRINTCIKDYKNALSRHKEEYDEEMAPIAAQHFHTKDFIRLEKMPFGWAKTHGILQTGQVLSVDKRSVEADGLPPGKVCVLFSEMRYNNGLCASEKIQFDMIFNAKNLTNLYGDELVEAEKQFRTGQHPETVYSDEDW